jgi:hypothetical protein
MTVLRVLAFCLGYMIGGGVAAAAAVVLGAAAGDQAGLGGRVAAALAVLACGLAGGYFAVHLVKKARTSDPDYDDRPPTDPAR